MKGFFRSLLNRVTSRRENARSKPHGCPNCRSQNVYYSKKRSCYVCEDCAETFTPEPEVERQTVFFSYGHDGNIELVFRLKADLERRGHRVWIDTADIKSGDNWRRSITEGLTSASRVLSFLSRHSVRSPSVCLDELRIALCVKGSYIKTVLLEKEERGLSPHNVAEYPVARYERLERG